MITTQTVLILGAGASKPYGFPIGEDLKNLICDNLIVEERNAEKIRLLVQMGFDTKLIAEFRKDLDGAEAYTIDEFLEHQLKYYEIGKASIALSLIPFETEKSLSGDWYQYLLSNLNTEFAYLDKNKISILTYNYDRSLEQYLFNAISHKYPNNEEQIIAKIKKIPIIHSHGYLGSLPWQESQGQKYSPELNIDRLRIAQQSIKIVHDKDIEENPEFIAAQNTLEIAKRIYFLGFGYDDINLERLDLKSAPQDSLICGTSYQLSRKKKRDLERNKTYQIKLYDNDCLSFLRHVVELD